MMWRGSASSTTPSSARTRSSGQRAAVRTVARRGRGTRNREGVMPSRCSSIPVFAPDRDSARLSPRRSVARTVAATSGRKACACVPSQSPVAVGSRRCAGVLPGTSAAHHSRDIARRRWEVPSPPPRADRRAGHQGDDRPRFQLRPRWPRDGLGASCGARLPSWSSGQGRERRAWASWAPFADR